MRHSPVSSYIRNEPVQLRHQGPTEKKENKVTHIPILGVLTHPHLLSDEQRVRLGTRCIRTWNPPASLRCARSEANPKVNAGGDPRPFFFPNLDATIQVRVAAIYFKQRNNCTEYNIHVRSKQKEITLEYGEAHSMDPVSGRLRRSGNEWKPVHAIA